jgi:hypothetical protein
MPASLNALSHVPKFLKMGAWLNVAFSSKSFFDMKDLLRSNAIRLISARQDSREISGVRLRFSTPVGPILISTLSHASFQVSKCCNTACCVSPVCALNALSVRRSAPIASAVFLICCCTSSFVIYVNPTKKSLPLSSTTMKAGKFSTSIFRMASMPRSSKSTSSTFLILFCAKIAAGPPMEPR